MGNAFQTVQTFFLQNPFKIRREREAAVALEKEKQRKIKKARRGKRK